MELRVTGLSYLLEVERPSILKQLALAHCPSPVTEVCSAAVSACCSVGSKSAAQKETSTDLLLLNNVSFQCTPGSVTAFMGLGLGYKVLLECISLRQLEGLMMGKIAFNGQLRSTGLFQDMVLLHDLGISHFSGLTVFEYLFYCARLRLTISIAECRERARYAARMLSLDGKCTIGNLHAVELRLLDIAGELVSPSLTFLCLLDPTEGLDASGKLVLLKMLHKIAHDPNHPVTVVYNVLTLDSDVVRFIDHLGVFVGNRLELFAAKLSSFPLKHQVTVAQTIQQMSSLCLQHTYKYRTAINDIHHMYALTMRNHLDQLIGLRGKELAEEVAIEERTSSKSIDSKSSRKEDFVTLYGSRRTKDADALLRIRKSVREECSILITRALSHYRNNVSINHYNYMSMCSFYWCVGYRDYTFAGDCCDCC
jgi:ABC-type multidrug transport system ATPase subunit